MKSETGFDTFRLDELPNMVYMTDENGLLQMVNAAGVRLLGFDSADQLVGKNIADFYVSREDREFYLETAGRQGSVHNLELLLRRRDGTHLVVLDSSITLRDDSGKLSGYQGIMVDITNRIERENGQLRISLALTEANLRTKSAQARLVQQARLASLGQLAAGVAHEVNNPLSFIVSNFRTLESYLSDLRDFIDAVGSRLSGSAEQSLFAEVLDERHVRTILDDSSAIVKESHQGFTRISSIIQELRTFARDDASSIEPSFDLNEAIEGAIVMTRNEWKYVATIRRELDDLPSISCSSNAIGQVLLNLILNAIQALRQDPRTREKFIAVCSWAEDDYVCCSVEDNAEGIPSDVVDKLYDPFVTTRPAGEGTGLGLSICYDIVVNRHGGDIAFDTNPGDGTRFIIRLPRNSRVDLRRTMGESDNIDTLQAGSDA